MPDGRRAAGLIEDAGAVVADRERPGDGYVGVARVDLAESGCVAAGVHRSRASGEAAAGHRQRPGRAATDSGEAGGDAAAAHRVGAGATLAGADKQPARDRVFFFKQKTAYEV